MAGSLVEGQFKNCSNGGIRRHYPCIRTLDSDRYWMHIIFYNHLQSSWTNEKLPIYLLGFSWASIV